MGFHDIRFPDLDEYGSSGGPGNSTNIIKPDSGQESRIVRWADFPHSFDVSWQVKKFETLAALKVFYLARGGLANTFRYKDWLDYNTTEIGKSWGTEGQSVTDLDQQIGTGDGTTTQFQMVKRYEDAAGSYVRTLTKIVDGTTVVALAGTPTASGWSINLVTGVITFDVAPTLGQVITAGCEFDVETRFGEGADEFFAARISSFGSGEVPTLPLKEVLAGGFLNEDRHFGGAKGVTVAVSTPTTMDLSALVWTFDASAANTNAILPLLSSVPAGGPIFIVRNSGSGGFIVHVVDSTLSSVCDLNDGESAQVFKGLDASGVAAWFAMVF